MLLHYLVKVKKRKCNITPGYYHRRLHQLHQIGPGSSCALNLLICGAIQQCVYETITHDNNDLQKRLMQTCFDIDRNIIDVDDHLRSCVRAGGGHFEQVLT